MRIVLLIAIVLLALALTFLLLGGGWIFALPWDPPLAIDVLGIIVLSISPVLGIAGGVLLAIDRAQGRQPRRISGLDTHWRT